MAADRLPLAGAAVFVFAHHDDEFFVAATMRRRAAAGAEVSAVWLTVGGLGGRQREAESRRAMELLGIGSDRLYCLRLPDGRAVCHLDEIIHRLEALFQRLRPAAVFVPAYEGGHPDHDAAQLAAAIALARTGLKADLCEFPLYHRYRSRFLTVGEFLPGPPEPSYTRLGLKERLLKKKMAGLYESQRPVMPALLSFRGGPLLLHPRGEPWRPVPAGRDYRQRPHGGRLAYEFYTRVRFRGFQAAVERLGGSPDLTALRRPGSAAPVPRR